jgi:hypothetical protein
MTVPAASVWPQLAHLLPNREQRLRSAPRQSAPQNVKRIAANITAAPPARAASPDENEGCISEVWILCDMGHFHFSSCP